MRGKPPKSTETLIAAASLCQLTGLTDMRHRQIAEKGYFPHPKEGHYVLNRTIAGMFRYYRERLHSREHDPVLKQRAKLAVVQTKLAEIQLQKSGEGYVSVESVLQELNQVGVAMRRIIERSALSQSEKDQMLLELRSLKLDEQSESREKADSDEPDLEVAA